MGQIEQPIAIALRRPSFACLMAVIVANALLGTPVLGAERSASETQLWIGAATADITPPTPVVLEGLQVTRTIHSRLAANVLALESRQNDRVIDQAILVSCDLCILPGVQDGFRKHLADRLAGFDPRKLFLAATHTHASPAVTLQECEGKEYEGAMRAEDYLPFLYQRLADAVVKAWQSRAVGAVAWGLGHAVVGRGRRVVYSDGSARMYGNSNDPKFRHVEGYEDHSVDVLCFYDAQQRLKATAVTLACPSQTVHGAISADFWHEVRERLRQRHGQELCVLGFCAPAGDQSPAPLYGKQAETRMERLRGLNHTQELGRRIAEAVEDTAGVITKDIRDDVPLIHRVEQVELPARLVTDAEHAIAKKVCDGIDAKKVRDRSDRYWRIYYGLVVDRYLAQRQGKRVCAIELHVLRLGDVAIATNPFELYVDYGVQIRARSAAVQTILIQLASAPQGYVGYVPTQRAVDAGGLALQSFNNYSATVLTNIVGPEGAQVLVDRTVETIRELWDSPKR